MRISLIQLFIICFVTSFGVSMASLPAAVAKSAHEDMWLSVLVGGVAFLFAVWVVTKLSSYFPQHSCIEYHRILLGPILGQGVNILLVILILLIPIVSVRSFVVAAKTYLFDITPPQVLSAAILILLWYAAQYGLQPIIRFQQLIFFSSHMVFFLIILMGLMAIQQRHYLPFLADGVLPVLKGAIPSWYAYTGPEIVIGMFYPFITRQKETFKWAAASVAALIVVYTVTTVIVQGILGPEETAHLLSPTIIAFRKVVLPDTFIERVDGYFLIFWIPVFIVCMLNWVYLAAFGIERILRLENSRPAVALLMPLILYFVIVPPDYQTASAISEWTNKLLIAWGAGILPLLLCIAWWKEKRRGAC